MSKLEVLAAIGALASILNAIVNIDYKLISNAPQPVQIVNVERVQH